MRDNRRRILLIVIRRQPVVFRARRRSRRRPRFFGKASGEKASGRLSTLLRCGASGRLIHHAITGETNQSNRRGPAAPSASRIRQSQTDHHEDAEKGGEPHGPESRSEACALFSIRVARRTPFEETLARDQHSPARSPNRIEAEKRLVRKVCKRKRDREQSACPVIRLRKRDAAGKHIVRLFQQLQERGQHRRHKDDPDHREGPEPGRRQDRPAEQQQERQCRRHETAPKVVEELPLRQQRERVLPAPSVSAGNNRRSQRRSCQSPRIHRCRRLTSAL